MTPAVSLTEKPDTHRISLAAASWLGLIYSLRVVGHTVFSFGAGSGMFRLFALALPGFDPDRPLSLLLGGAEMLRYGGLGGALFATVYNALPSRPAATLELFPRNHRSRHARGRFGLPLAAASK